MFRFAIFAASCFLLACGWWVLTLAFRVFVTTIAVRETDDYLRRLRSRQLAAIDKGLQPPPTENHTVVVPFPGQPGTHQR